MSTRAEPILLTDMESGAEVVGTLLYDPSYEELKLLDAFWRPYVRLAMPEFEMRQAFKDSVPDYVAWDWAVKMSLAKRASWRFFCITYRDFVQGAVVISTAPTLSGAVEHRGAQALGIEFLATAPWNIGRFMRSIKREPLLDLIGPTLMRVAIALSQATPGCEGRLYLYAVPKAERFYRVNCGMIDLGQEDHNGEFLRRFEMTSERATEFMSGG